MIFYRAYHRPLALTFDLDDTLYNNKPVLQKAEQAMLDFLHLHYAATQSTDLAFWHEIKRLALFERPALHNDMGELRRVVLRRGLLHCGYQGVALEHAIDSTFEYFYDSRSQFKVDKNICSLLARLAEKLPLVAITNGNVDLQKIGIAEYFRFSLHASLSQPMKPHAAMFNLAARQLDLAPQDILHIGDNLYNDVLGALQAGYQAAWYAANRNMQLTQEPGLLLPHVQLHELSELLQLV
ncbi:HAD-IA family hydrolase [Bowmanella pacifica]|uniref:2-haloalkanoic acid dehalogenase n=1 Tax=Bowmanella pacifica TaxID=502051 RepID=A0A917YWJ5_9ALTE|nr:HAD-IA family hydrolase [Bowmanella pacifica]GGO66397.1 2-haloalkanoic acid dehalogenase [Bowmanella pacifica]